MDWINEPEEGVAPACGNCFFYAHGGCTKRCPNQSCTPYGVHRLFKDILASSA